MAVRIQLRRDTAYNWTTNNPMLYPGEVGLETDTLQFKVGPAVEAPAVGTAWNSIAEYANVVPGDLNSTLNGYVEVTDIGAIGGVVGLNNSKNAIIPGTSIIIEGATNNDFETTLSVADPTADRTIVFPDESGTVALLSDVSALISEVVDFAPAALDTLYELAAALDNDASYASTVTTALSNKQDKVLNVSDTEIGYLANVTSDIQTQINSKLTSSDLDEAAQEAVNTALVAGTGLDKTYDDLNNTITLDIDSTVATKTYADDAVSTHSSDTTSVHGIADTAALATKTYADDAVSTHSSDTASVHGIADTAELATKTFAAELLTNATKTNITITGDKNGLTISAENGVADSTTTDLAEGTNLYFTDERAQDAAALALDNGTHENITVSYNDSINAISLIVAAPYTDENAQDAVGNAVGNGLTYTDSTGEIKVTPNTYDAYGSASTVQGNLEDHASDTVTHGVTGNIVGTSDTQTLSNKTLNSPKINEDIVLTATATELNILDGITSSTSELNILDGATLTTTELNYVDGVTSGIQGQIDLKAPLASPVFTGGVSITNGAGLDSEGLIQAFGGLYVSGNTTLDGDLLVNGVSTSVNTANTSVADNMIYLNEAISYTIIDATGDGTSQVYTTSVDHDLTTAMVVRITGMDPAGYNKSSYVAITAITANSFTVLGSETGTFVSGGTAHAKSNVNPDLGLSGGYNDGTYHHAGMFRDASDGKWKFFQGYEPEPSGAFIDTADASFELAPLKVAGFEATEAIIGDVTNTELQYVHGVTSAIQTQLDAKAATADIAELAQDAVGNNVTSGLSYNDSTGAIGINYVTVGNTLLDGVSGASYGLIGTSTYLDVKDTNGYNKEIELDIAAVESKLDTDGYITTSSTSTLTNKTLTSPKINEDVAVTATATELNVLDGITASTSELNILDGATLSTTELNYVDGVTSAIQTQLDGKQAIVANVSSTEIGYLDGVTSSIQDQLNSINNTAVSGYDFGYGISSILTGTTSDGYLLTANGSGGYGWEAAPISLPSQSGNNGKYLTTDGSAASWTTLSIPITTGTATITSNTATTIDTVSSTYASAEYLISIRQEGKIRTSKVLMNMEDSYSTGTVDITEFGIVETGGAIAGVSITGNYLSLEGPVLQVTITDAASTNAAVKFTRVVL